MSNKRKSVYWLIGLICLGIVGFFILTSPTLWSMTHPKRDVADNNPPNLENGKTMYIAGDCATCHAVPDQGDHLRLGGGRALDTEFGRFYMPNISPDKNDGIGNWTLAQFTKAMREGVGPGNVNLYPAFPYTSYQRMTANDVRDLFAYIQTLEAVPGKAPDHELKFPFTIRRGVGVWRLFFLDGKPLSAMADATPEYLRGQYLVEGPGHCAECHSPRNFMGVVKANQRYGGGATPNGIGHFPNISQHETGIGFWATNSIVNYLRTGVSPIGKIASGDMAEVIENTKDLSDADLKAMALYLKTVPGVDRPMPGQPEPNYTNQVVMLPQTQALVVNMPVASTSELAKVETAYVTNTKNFYMASEMSGDPDGKLLGATKLTIVERDGDKLKVRLDGWQLAGADTVFYALQSQRIMQAVLDKTAVAGIEHKEAVTDQETQQTWYPSSLTVWVDDKGLNTALEPLWAYSQDTFNSSCGTCHTLPESDHYLANQWIGNLNAMKRYTSLTDDQYRLLLAYLQNHSKDVNVSGKSH